MKKSSLLGAVCALFWFPGMIVSCSDPSNDEPVVEEKTAEKTEYKITYKSYIEGIEDKVDIVPIGEEYTVLNHLKAFGISTAVLKRQEKNFIGWALIENAEANDVVIRSGEKFLVREDLTFYPVVVSCSLSEQIYISSLSKNYDEWLIDIRVKVLTYYKSLNIYYTPGDTFENEILLHSEDINITSSADSAIQSVTGIAVDKGKIFEDESSYIWLEIVDSEGNKVLCSEPGKLEKPAGIIFDYNDGSSTKKYVRIESGRKEFEKMCSPYDSDASTLIGWSRDKDAVTVDYPRNYSEYTSAFDSRITKLYGVWKVKAPSSLKVTEVSNEDATVKISFRQVSGISDYIIYVGEEKVFISADPNSYVSEYIYTLPSKDTKTYSFCVQADADIAEKSSEVSFAYRLLLAPTTPQNLTVNQYERGYVYLTWKCEIGQNYYVYVNTENNFSTARFVEDIDGKQMNIRVDKEGTYYFWVKAYNDGKYSEISDVISITPTAVIVAPPKLSIAQKSGTDRLELTITKKYMFGYDIYMAEVNDFSKAEWIRGQGVAVVTTDDTYYEMENLKSGTYYFWIRGWYDNIFNTSGERDLYSDWSEAIPFTYVKY